MPSAYDSPLIPLEDSPEEEFVVEYTRDKFNRYGSEDIGFRYDQYHQRRKKSSITVSKQTLCCYSTIGVVVVCLVGIVIGRYSFRSSNSSAVTRPEVVVQRNVTTQTDDYAVIRDYVFKEMKAANMEGYLKDITAKPHIAGSEQDEDHVLSYVKDHWSKHLDEVKVYPYNVLLSFPNVSDPNYVAFVYPNDTIAEKTNWTEEPLTDFERKSADNVLPAFNAYSPAGHVSGRLYYVNYGRYEDYDRLQEMNVNVSGGICMVRYGELFRGDKVVEAERRKCAGLIIFSDPADYAGVEKQSWDPSKGGAHAYPHTWWLPPHGVQRGVIGDMGGDPLTPNYPSLNFTYRIPESEAVLPKIPVQPISYADAYKYLSILGGKTADDSWQGGLNITYRTGGSFVGSHANCSVLLHVGNYLKRKTIHTLLGFIRGSQEPDRYVLLGNHRDAWTFGGEDPSSGTAVVLEVARAMGSVVKSKQWRPRRTVVFCNWAAEEHGLIGSTEWVQQMEKQLMTQAVSYVNIDMAMEGNDTIRALAVPELFSLLFNATGNVPNPDPQEYRNNRTTVYATWLAKYYDQDNPTRPYIGNIGSGSDYTMLLQKAGVPSVDIRYTYLKHVSSYPVYHSIHDTFEYAKKFLDPDFNCSLALGRVAADLLLQLSSLSVLPLKPVEYANKLHDLAVTLQKDKGRALQKQHVPLEELFRVVQVFNASANLLADKIKLLAPTSDPLTVRQINDKLTYINRGFLDFVGVPGRPQYRHVIFAPSSHDSYSGSAFPGIVDSIFLAERGEGSWDDVRREISAVCVQILSAASFMKEW